MKTLLLLAAGCLLALCPAQAAESIHVIVKGKKQGIIKGELADDTIEALAYQHEITVPTDPTTGQSTGRRQHKPLTIVKAIDKSTPGLYAMIVTNEASDVTLKFYRKDPKDGVTKNYYTIVLKNAFISNIRGWKPNTRDLSADRAGDLEEVSFRYQTITGTYTEGGFTFEDDWSSTGA
ncbi:type VI secretion system tube protein TssD [Haloferula sp. BvORR071]|uniref:type VI secretion system tube protein TssD n=1 Tax=Haloferula sp. BvORR071 TaxID=1396141 RepID=UPI000697C187|nr:type VI secretion system tube protein TssD [Haloferula sp. BvORR071]